MTERMTKAQVLKHLASKTGLSKQQVAAVLDELALLAYREARNSFQIPGLGIITLAERPARQMVIRFGPRAGQTVTVPARPVLRFRFTKAAKEAILGVAKDNLEIIEGIGPKIAEALYQAGILTFQQLADTPVERLRQILDAANYLADPTTWPQQARLAAEGKLEELERLKASLTAGRVA